MDTLLSISVSSALGTNPTWRPTSGTTLQFTATGTYSISGAQDITGIVTWSSGTPGTATISAGGEATAVSANTGTNGDATTSLITATLGAVSGSTTLSLDTDRDATAGKRVPVNAYQWGLLGYTVAHLYLCQETSGNLVDVIGGVNMTATLGPTYDNPVTGWSRRAVGFNNVTNQSFRIASGTGPSAATSDIFWAWYVQLPDLPASNRSFFGYGSSTAFQMTATGALRLAGVDDTTTRPDTDDLVHPVGLLHNITTSVYGLVTDEANTNVTYAALTESIKTLGATAANTSPDNMLALYGFALVNANCPTSLVNARSVFTALGW